MTTFEMVVAVRLEPVRSVLSNRNVSERSRPVRSQFVSLVFQKTTVLIPITY